MRSDLSHALASQHRTSVVAAGLSLRRRRELDSPRYLRRMTIAGRSLLKLRDLMRIDDDELDITHGEHRGDQELTASGDRAEVVTRFEGDEDVITGVKDRR